MAPKNLRILAENQLRDLDYTGLIATLTRLIAETPNNKNHYFNIAKSYWHLNEYRKLHEILKIGIRQCPEHEAEFCVLAVRLLFPKNQIDFASFWLKKSFLFRDAALECISIIPASLDQSIFKSIFNLIVNNCINDNAILVRLLDRTLVIGLLNEAKQLISELEKRQETGPDFRLMRLDERVSGLPTQNILTELESLAADPLASPEVIKKSFINRARLLHKSAQNTKALRLIQSFNKDQARATTETLRIEYSFHHYSPDSTAQDLRSCQALWQKKSTASVQNHVIQNSSNKLRIGFISSGFRAHPVGYMTSGFFCESFKRFNTVNTILFDNKPSRDFVAQTIQNNVHEYHDTSLLDRESLIQLINSKSLDFLVDLDGFSAENKMEAVLEQKAPVIKWVGGLIGSTYLDGMDYLITDSKQTPSSLQGDFSEQLILMPDTYVTYTPPPYRIDIKEPPNSVSGYITFGCFNNGAKISEQTIDLWSSILLEVPNSRLVLKDGVFDDVLGKNAIGLRFVENGIDANRLVFKGKTSHKEHLETFQYIDICLDPTPYSGGLTTLESAYMGVPVITLSGQMLAHRHSTTHLITIGHPELVSTTETEYYQKAISLAGDFNAIRSLRHRLRDDLYKSPLVDHQLFVENFIKKMAELKESGH